MKTQQYGVHNRSEIFNSLEEAEDYVLKEYPEYCMSKDAAYDLCENIIYEI